LVGREEQVIQALPGVLMKRALILLITIVVFTAAYMSIWGCLPFIPVIESGMEPSIQSGSLIITAPVVAQEIKRGAIIVYKTPSYVREKYSYPPVLIRRIAEIQTGSSQLLFQTSGDSAGNDPFLAKAQEIHGAIGYVIPYLGLPLLFLYSRAGILFSVIFIILLLLYLYSNEIKAPLSRSINGIIYPVIEESNRANLVLSNRIDGTQKALDNFAGAMQEYARHMASHTSAIQGLSEASQALKNSAIEQNQILSRFSHTFEREKSARELAQVKRVVSELEKRTHLVLQVKEQLEGKTPAAEVLTRVEAPPKVQVQSPPGCIVNARALHLRGHYFTKSPALRPSNN
jgi:signal peptidase I